MPHYLKESSAGCPKSFLTVGAEGGGGTVAGFLSFLIFGVKRVPGASRKSGNMGSTTVGALRRYFFALVGA